MKEMIFVLTIFWLPVTKDEWPNISQQGGKEFSSLEDCRNHLIEQDLKELEIYKFIDNGGKPGFYLCQGKFD